MHALSHLLLAGVLGATVLPSWAQALPQLAKVTVTAAQPESSSSTVLDSDTLQQWAPRRLEDMAAMVPGAQVDVANGGLSTAIKLRGFGVTRTSLNGLPDIQRMYTRDMATVDLVTILPGPQALWYGIASPGGAVDYTLKQAHFTPARQLDLSVGSSQYTRAMLDLNTPWAGSERIASRIVVATQDGRSSWGELPQRDHVLLGSLVWEPRPLDRLALELEEQQNHTPYAFGTVITNSAAASPANVQTAQVRYDQLYVQPGGAPATRNNHRMALQWDQQLSPQLQWSTRYQYAMATRDETLLGFWTQTSPSALSGYYTRYHDSYRQHNARSQLKWTGDVAGWQHDAVAGIDLNRAAWNFTGVQNINGFQLNMAQPDFSHVNIAALATTPRFNTEHQRDASAWLRDRIGWHNDWHLHFGLRHLYYRIDSDRTGAGLAPVAQSATTTVATGLEWQLHPQLQAYANYGEGVQPNRGLTHAGDFLPAESTRQWELGGRWSGTGLQTQLAAYRVDLHNLPMRDPQDRLALVSTGARRVHGMEAAFSSVQGAWTWKAQANTLATQQIVKTSAALGDAFVGVARHTGSIQLQYQASPGTRLWGLVQGTGSRFADAANTLRLPGYSRIDLGIHNQLTSAMSLQLGLRNLANRRYVESVSAPDDVYQGSLRQTWLTARLAL
jgi:iron complex outermembrane receptor protein